MSTKILIIETTTKSCSVCLSKDGAPWIVREIQDQAGHAEKLTLFIQEIMDTAAMQLQELDAIAVSQGPGSYTGLRIGISTAKGLCYALNKPLLAIDSLQALAWGAAQWSNSAKAAYIALMDARRMDAYVGIYNNTMDCLKKPYFATLEATSFDFLLEKEGIEQLVLVGDATAKYQPVITDRAEVVFSPILLPSSKYLAALAQKAYEKEDFVDVAYFEPFYLKMPNITKPKPKF